MTPWCKWLRRRFPSSPVPVEEVRAIEQQVSEAQATLEVLKARARAVGVRLNNGP